ncbi:MAG: GHKL domain-containing protein [Bacteroidetes bacterium]|nr:GHKL domain-containing protein [Bacteroidota bacterium]
MKIRSFIPGSRRLRVSATLMMLAIIGMSVFQVYWFKKLYGEEWAQLKKETEITFRDVIYKIQIQRFQNDSSFTRRQIRNNLYLFDIIDSFDTPRQKTGPATGLVIRKDSGHSKDLMLALKANFHADTLNHDTPEKRMISMQTIGPPPGPDGQMPLMIRVITPADSGSNTLSIGHLDSAYKTELLKNRIDVPYVMLRVEGRRSALEQPVPANQLKTSCLFIGLSNVFAYQASFDNPFRYILHRLRLPLSMAVLLLAFTTASFVFLYRNLKQQQQLAVIKNDFISNMTHELKTPISTVKVAVEALRHFDALNDPQKTREYLDISALELQRLSLLVDKVLKLSSFENKEIELNKTDVDLHELAAETIASMRLQLEKTAAFVQLTTSGERWIVKADRTHMSSVFSNLLDNALKYCKEIPVITIHLSENTGPAASVDVAFTDNGIGIPPGYISRIFEKFFRVPSGDHHDIKGYGLGLSYVHHIVTRHNGSIAVESKEGKGTSFTIKLPVA